MATRIEMVIERVAMAFLQNVSAVGAPHHVSESLEKSFLARWPSEESRFPMLDARKAAILAATAGGDRLSADADHAKGQWKASSADVWEKAVDDTIEEYFETSRENFRNASPMAGSEALTDAVRAALVYIAAGLNWPHSTDDDLYRVSTALATGGSFPGDSQNLYELQKSASEEGIDLCSSLAASMGRPGAVRFGLYSDSPNGPGYDATYFARRTIDLAKRLSKGKAVAP